MLNFGASKPRVKGGGPPGSATAIRRYSKMLHTNAAPNCFYPALSGCYVVKCTFSLLFFFSVHHVSSSVLTVRD